MSETQTQATGGVTEKRKLTVRDLGNPKKVTVLPDGQDTLMLGTIIGRITGTVLLKSPDGDEFEAFKGTFEGVSNDTGEIINAGILTLPAGFHDKLMTEFKMPDVKEIQFAYGVGCVKAKNPQGYSWAFKPLLEAQPTDALSELRKLRQDKMKALPAPTSAKPVEDRGKAKAA